MSVTYSSNRSSWGAAKQRSLTMSDWSLSFWTNAALATVRFTFAIEQGREEQPNTAPRIRAPNNRGRVHRDNAAHPRKSDGAAIVGVGAFSGSLRGLKLVPAKWRYLVPPMPARRVPRRLHAGRAAHRLAHLDSIGSVKTTLESNHCKEKVYGRRTNHRCYPQHGR